LRIGQGRENAKQFLKDNPQLADEIETKLRKHLNLAPMQPPAEKPASAEAAAAKPAALAAEAPREKEKARR
jgi:recombination protein RecA